MVVRWAVKKDTAIGFRLLLSFRPFYTGQTFLLLYWRSLSGGRERLREAQYISYFFSLSIFFKSFFYFTFFFAVLFCLWLFLCARDVLTRKSRNKRTEGDEEIEKKRQIFYRLRVECVRQLLMRSNTRTALFVNCKVHCAGRVGRAGWAKENCQEKNRGIERSRVWRLSVV